MLLEPQEQDSQAHDRKIHRKFWEWSAIAEVLSNRGMLRPGRSGLGFAVGREPLPSLFASFGVRVVGTDLGSGDAVWSSTNQHAGSTQHLFHAAIVDQETFDWNVRFQPADMTDFSDMPDCGFDFVWSSCSFEHLGSLESGIAFVTNAMRLIKPGGIAVHTTEYNVSSNQDTIETGGSVIYRKSDIEDLGFLLRKNGAALETVDFDAGSHVHDIDYDFPPHETDGRKHVKILLYNHISTSILLVMRKGRSVIPSHVLTV